MVPAIRARSWYCGESDWKRRRDCWDKERRVRSTRLCSGAFEEFRDEAAE